MAHLTRIVLPLVPHHATQRGNRRLQVYFADEDRLFSSYRNSGDTIPITMYTGYLVVLIGISSPKLMPLTGEFE